MAETTESAAPAAAPPPPPAPEADPSDTMFQALDAPADEPTSAPSAAEPQPAPPSTPSAAPAPAAASEPAAAPTDRQVPLAVLLEERRRGDEKLAQALARIEALEKGVKPAETPAAAAEPEAPVPDFLENPQGYVDARVDAAVKALKKLEEGGNTDPRLKAIEQRQAESELSTALAADQERFSAKTPDFQDALNYARVARAKQLEVLNPGVKPEQIVQWVHQEERGLAAHLVRNGINPAERVYELAKSMGYTPKQAAALAAASPPAGSGNGVQVVDPGLTLNSTPGTTHSEVDDSEPDILAQAQAERFVRARRN